MITKQLEHYQLQFFVTCTMFMVKWSQEGGCLKEMITILFEYYGDTSILYQ